MGTLLANIVATPSSAFLSSRHYHVVMGHWFASASGLYRAGITRINERRSSKGSRWAKGGTSPLAVRWHGKDPAAARHDTLVMACHELRLGRLGLIIMESPSPMVPKRTKKLLKAYLFGLIASGGWVFGWPVLYAHLHPALKNEAFYRLTHAAAALWFFSLIVFFVFLILLTEYWPALSYAWDILGFIVEFLSLFVPF